jgi:hypothetical protein
MQAPAAAVAIVAVAELIAADRLAPEPGVETRPQRNAHAADDS